VLIASLASLLIATSARADRLNGFKLDHLSVDRELIRAGGPPRDGIPSIDKPRFVSARNADHLQASDRVLGIRVNGIARAYPVRILNHHEIVNDWLGNTPVVISYCPLCASGIAFQARINKQRREFGVSGLLYNSDVLLYDRQTKSLWSQIGAEAISGPARGARLVALATRNTSWADWLKRNPDTQVLAEPRGTGRNYHVDPYLGYADSNRIWFPVAHRDTRLPAKSIVVGIVVNDAAYAWPFSALDAAMQTVSTHAGGQTVRLDYDLDAQTARVSHSDGREIPSFTAFWFAWVAFHPDTGLYE
jgi:YD repeat-containing protein